MFAFSARPFGRRRPVRGRTASLVVETLEARTVMSGSPGAEDALVATTLAEPPAAAQPTSVAIVAIDQGGNSLSRAKNLGPLDGTISLVDFAGPTDRNDYYKFTVARTAEFRLDLTGLSADLDVYLLNSQGQTLAKSIGPDASNEQIVRQLTKGTYFVRVVPYGSAASDYALRLSAALDKGGDSQSRSTNLGTLGATPLTAADFVGGIDKYDYYHFTVGGPTDVQIKLTGLSQNADLWLFDSRGKLVEYSTDGYGSANEEIVRNLGKGTWYVVVDPSGAAKTNYQLTIQQYVPNAPPPPSPPGADPLPDVPNYGGANDWNLNKINAPEAWAAGYTGQGVVVAVVDTGVDYNHVELVGSHWTNAGEIAGNGRDDDGNGYADDVHGWDFVNRDGNPFDDQGHGTHVAGTIAGAYNGFGVTGVAYDATVMAVKVLSASGSGSYLDVAAGIRYAVDNGARVVNLSLGGAIGSTSLQAAIEYAAQNDVLIVAAAGNNSGQTPSWPAQYAALYNNVISVGAHDSSDKLAYFSNKVGNSGTVQVDAPGVNVYSTLPNGSYANYNGTSMATPHVVGLAALMLSANANLSAAQLRSLIVATAARTIAGSDSLGGIDAAYAVAAALDPSSVLGGAAGQTFAAPSGGSGATVAIAALDVSGPASENVAPAGVAERTTVASGVVDRVEAVFARAVEEFRSRREAFGGLNLSESREAGRVAAAAEAASDELFARADEFAAAFGWLGASV